MAVAQELAADKTLTPNTIAKLLLVSPWVDLEMQNPKILEIDPWDPLLSKAGLDVAASLYAGDRRLSDPWLSPINGKLQGLPPTTILIGSHDIFYGDSLKLAELLADAGVKVSLEKAFEQLHVYPIFPTPEGRRGIEQLADAVLN
jgi:acetyl esterase/lipase